MKIDLYVSEISVSDFHGGGLTLQRILGDQLNEITQYAVLGMFGLSYPPNEQTKKKTRHYIGIFESKMARAIMGNRLAYWINRRAFMARFRAFWTARKIATSFESKETLNVLVIPQSVQSLLVIEALGRIKKIKYITWFMDDHLIRFNNGKWVYSNVTHDLMAFHLRNAVFRFVISDVLAEIYKEKFKVSSSVLYGPSDHVGHLNILPCRLGEGCRLAYFGAVAAWQEDALISLMDKIRGTHHSLTIYSSTKKLPAGLNCDNVIYGGFVGGADVKHEMSKYDAVVLPVSGLSNLRNMSEINVATKMSECLSSGTMVLVIAPDYAAMRVIISKYKAALFLDEPGDIFDKILDGKVRGGVLVNAKRLVLEECSVAVMYRRWNEGLASFCSN